MAGWLWALLQASSAAAQVPAHFEAVKPPLPTQQRRLELWQMVSFEAEGLSEQEAAAARVVQACGIYHQHLQLPHEQLQRLCEASGYWGGQTNPDPTEAHHVICQPACSDPFQNAPAVGHTSWLTVWHGRTINAAIVCHVPSQAEPLLQRGGWSHEREELPWKAHASLGHIA